MELWIRSQDKRHLIKADYVSIMENNIINVASSGWDYDVAKYKSEERALEVLDKIKEYVKDNACYDKDIKQCCRDLLTDECDYVLELLEEIE